MQVVTASQLTLELQSHVRQRFATLRECLHWTALNDTRGIKAIAADCDLSVSELSRRLHPSEDDPRSCDVNLMVKVMHSTRDMAPLHWLMAEFLQDAETKRRVAVDQLSTIMPQIAALLADAGVTSKGGRK